MTATIGGAFDGAEIHSDLVFGGRFANAVEIAVLDGDSLTDVIRVQSFLQLRFKLRAIGTFNPKRIARYQSLTEGDESAAFGRGLIDPFDDLRDSRVSS